MKFLPSWLLLIASAVLYFLVVAVVQGLEQARCYRVPRHSSLTLDNIDFSDSAFPVPNPMSSRPSQRPWPAQTSVYQSHEPASPAPTPQTRSPKRRRSVDDDFGRTPKLIRRQTVANQKDVDDALWRCRLFVANDIESCHPTSDTTVLQGQWVSFVWNSRRPQITQNNRVDLYLFTGDSRVPILNATNIPNPQDQAGRKNFLVDDIWWGDNGSKWHGENASYPFYFVIIPSGTTLDANAIPQSTFTAVQTTYADSVIASMSSSSASAASASLSSASAASLASVSSALSASLASLSSVRASSTSASTVQENSSSGDFPHWAIAVIVVLGFLAIAVTCILTFLIIRRVRRRNELDSKRNSMGSASPMMANPGGPSSPLLAGAAIGGNHPGSIGGGRDSHTAQRDAPSVVMHDGASTISRAGSAANNEGPFSGADAAIMADAFRKMLRKPDFAGRPVEEGESPDGPDHGEGKEELINRELAEEGRDIRSVSSERGVRVETLSDSGDTVHDRRGRDMD